MAKNAIIDVFREVLNELHLSLKFTVEKENLVVSKTLIYLQKS